VNAEREIKALSADALGHWRAKAAHSVQHRAGDRGLGLLGRQGPGAKAAADSQAASASGVTQTVTLSRYWSALSYRGQLVTS